MSYTIKIKFGKKMAKKLFAKKTELMSSLEEDAFNKVNILEMLKAVFSADEMSDISVRKPYHRKSKLDVLIDAILGAKPYKVTKHTPRAASRRQIDTAIKSLFVPADGKLSAEMSANYLRKRVEREIGMFVNEIELTQALDDLGYKSKVEDDELYYLLNYANHQASHTENGNA